MGQIPQSFIVPSQLQAWQHSKTPGVCHQKVMGSTCHILSDIPTCFLPSEFYQFLSSCPVWDFAVCNVCNGHHYACSLILNRKVSQCGFWKTNMIACGDGDKVLWGNHILLSYIFISHSNNLILEPNTMHFVDSPHCGILATCNQSRVIERSFGTWQKHWFHDPQVKANPPQAIQQPHTGCPSNTAVLIITTTWRNVWLKTAPNFHHLNNLILPLGSPRYHSF